MVINPLLASGLQDCIGGAWLHGIHSDFTLEVEGTTFKCHRFILAACSEFFKCMLNSDMKESLQNSATIGDIDRHTMSTVLSALYTGVDGLNQDNIYEVWRAVHQLQISYMVNCCENFAMKNISKENFLKILQLAKLLKSDAVVAFAERFIIKNFKEIINTESFLELSSDEMYNVLQSNDLNVHTEDTVLESILTWCKFNSSSDSHPKCLETGKEKSNEEVSSAEKACTGKDVDDTQLQSNESSEVTATEGNLAKRSTIPQTDDRSKHMKRLLSNVRLYLVSYECLQKALLDLLPLSYPDACRLLIDAITYQMEVKRRHFAWPLSAIHRISSDKEHVMVFWSTSHLLQSYRFNSNTFADIYPENSLTFTRFQGLCVYDNTLLISCYRSNTNDHFTVMLTDEKMWEDVTKVEGSSSSLLLSAHGQNMYQLFGSQLQRMSLGKGFSRAWKKCISFYHVFSPHTKVTVYRDSLIIFDPDKSYILWVDLNTMKYRTVTRVEGLLQDIVSFGNQEEIYILHRDGALRKIVSPNAEELKFQFITQLWDGDWELRGAFLFLGGLYVFGKDLRQEANSQILVPSLAGVYNSVKVVNINTDFPCWPMVVSKSW